MPAIDKTRPDSPKSIVHLQCEGIRTNGAECLAEVALEFPRLSDKGKGLTAAQRVTKARKLATKDGWRSPRGLDECPKVHGFMPTARKPERPEL